MKLWQKNYFFTALLFTAVLFACVGILIAPVIRGTLSSARDAALLEEKSIAGIYDTMFLRETERKDSKSERDPELNRIAMERFAAYYAEGGSYLRIEANGDDPLLNTLPFDLPAMPGSLRWVRENGQTYIAIGDDLGQGKTLTYIKDVSDVGAAAWRQGITAIGICFLLCLLVNAALYSTMLRINRPLSMLAHELRTPLTAIRGYGELLAIATLSEQQRHNATSYIVSECDRLKDIVGKILTMNDKSGILRERIPLEALQQHMEWTWPSVAVRREGDAAYGDRSLLISLLDNLIGNAEKAGSTETTLTLASDLFVVQDRGCGMTEEQLAYANDPAHHPLPQNVRSGLGIPLCHEIAAAHHAVLRYESKIGEGTTVTFRFYNSETSR